MRKIPLGEQDFKDVRESGVLYIDKSLLLKDILMSYDKGVYLFTRPRRFGKSLNLSMIDAFLNLNYGGNGWFEGLKVSEYPELEEYKNCYPVLYLDMSILDYNSYSEFIASYRTMMFNLVGDYSYLLDSDRLDDASKRILHEARFGTIPEEFIKHILNEIVRDLRIHHGKKVVILIQRFPEMMHF